MGVTFKLLPVCECGYAIRDLKINRDEKFDGWNYVIPFTPSRCPNCHEFIDAMTIDLNMLKDAGFIKEK